MDALNRCAGALALSLVVSCPARAEEAYPLKPGSRCRVTAPTLSRQPVTGTYVRSDDGEMVIVGPKIGRYAVPLEAVTRVESSGGRHSKSASFALRGALLGFGVAAIASPMTSQAEGGCSGAGGGCVVKVALRTGAAWGCVGAVVGWAVRTEDWKEVGREAPKVSLAPVLVSGSGGGVVFALRW